MTGQEALEAGGSPPRVRGTDPKEYEVPEAIGITPACAGNRCSKGEEAEA